MWPLILHALILPSALGPAQSSHRALIVGVGDYHAACDKANDLYYSDLSTAPDVDHLQRALVASGQFHNTPSEIQTLGPVVTKAALISKLRWLIAGSNPNDLIYFHFSGHGCTAHHSVIKGIYSKAGEDNGLVLSDSHGEDANRLLLSGELSALLKRARSRHIFVTIDACHSGGMDRAPRLGIYRPRGVAAQAAGPERAFVPSSENSVVFCASRMNQTANESAKGGVFSLALAHALAQTKGDDVSYRDLFDSMNDEMHAETAIENQDPVAEGKLDQTVFTNQSLARQSYFPVRVENTGRKVQVVLEAGQVHGVTRGTQVALYQASVSGKPIGYGTVADPGASESILTTTLSPALLHASKGHPAKAVVSKVGVSDGNLILLKDSSCSETDLEEIIQDQPVQTVTQGKYDLKLISRVKNLVLTSASGGEIGSASNTPEGRASIQEAISQTCRWRSLMFLQNSVGGSMKIRIRVRHVVASNDGQYTFQSALPLENNDGTSFGKEGRYSFQVMATPDRGQSWKPSIAVLNLNPNRRVGQTWPLDYGEQVKYTLEPNGKWYWLGVEGKFIDSPSGNNQVQVWQFTPTGQPTPDGIGTQVFKILATREPVNYIGLLDATRGPSSTVEGDHSALGRLVKRYSFGTRGPTTTGSVAAKDWATSSCIAVNNK